MTATEMSRRTFFKLAAATAAASAVGLGVEQNLQLTEKAYADDETIDQKTFCRACPRACGVIATIRNGRVVRLRGNPDDILSQGGMCAKGISGIQALYHPNRTKYPMKRIGERGVDNTWERISWDEAIDMIAGAMADMRDRYGRNGLLETTGGGGNPRIIDSIAFRDYWGAGNVFEPGAAQCAMPRTFIQKQMDGWLGFTSIGDMQCEGCFNPNWDLDVFVQMGGGGAASSSTITAHFWNDLRDRGTKFINVDPRFTHDSARASLWIPIRPGTDVAAMMYWINYLFENGGYDEEFLLKWSNLPFLVDVTDEGKTPELGQLLRASSVQGLDMSAGEGYVYYDTVTKQVTKAFAMGPDNEDTYNPQLFGTVEVTYADGTVRTCKTAGQLLKESVADMTLEKAAEICWVDPEKLETAAKWINDSTSFGGVGNGVSHDQNIQSAEAAMCTTLINQLKGTTQQPGANATSPHPHGEYTTGKERGRFTYSMSYDGRGYFNPNVDDDGNPVGPYIQLPQVIERLGYIEHKGLGDWKHSQIPAVYDAIVTGEPYQPRVWYERSGNKMVTLADSSSWLKAFPKLDFISHTYMYPTSFTFEAADLILPCTEWLESDYAPGAHGDCNGFMVACALLYEHVDDRLIYGTIFKALADNYDDPYAYSIYYTDHQYYTIREREEYLADIAIEGMTWE
ncbi:MAG: molybdopterin-dependent oxidoreductase, partial [Eggerthellaceae bacterium]|nr:molybdopterin-dependent oxidoreductase [Eggerthellaceae bacterium]